MKDKTPEQMLAWNDYVIISQIATSTRKLQEATALVAERPNYAATIIEAQNELSVLKMIARSGGAQARRRFAYDMAVEEGVEPKDRSMEETK